MDFDLTEEHLAIQDAVGKVCSDFDDEYWTEKDTKAEFPHEFHRGHGRRRLAGHYHA